MLSILQSLSQHLLVTLLPFRPSTSCSRPNAAALMIPQSFNYVHPQIPRKRHPTPTPNFQLHKIITTPSHPCSPIHFEPHWVHHAHPPSHLALTNLNSIQHRLASTLILLIPRGMQHAPENRQRKHEQHQDANTHTQQRLSAIPSPFFPRRVHHFSKVLLFCLKRGAGVGWEERRVAGGRIEGWWVCW